MIVRVLHREGRKGNQQRGSKKIFDTDSPGPKRKRSSAILCEVPGLLKKGFPLVPVFSGGRRARSCKVLLWLYAQYDPVSL